MKKAGQLPENVVRGEKARLFPILSTNSKEGRTTAITLACMALVGEFAKAMLAGIGQRIGSKAKVGSYTEVVFQNQPEGSNDRPDGLLVVDFGQRKWSALIEAKVGSAGLQFEQIERYRVLAKANGIDCVITVSNQFATSPGSHPLAEVRKSRSKIPVYHWSWLHALTTVDLLLSTDAIADADQQLLLSELHRFLTHESTEVRGFERMPREWTEISKLVSSGGAIQANSANAKIVINAWHQETRNLALILSRLTETVVGEKLPMKHRNDPSRRQKDELAALRENSQLIAVLDIRDAAAPIEIVADLKRRSIDVGMSLQAPEDRKTTKARLNWLLRQIKTDDLDNLAVRVYYKGRAGFAQYLIRELKENIGICEEGGKQSVARGFHLFRSKQLAKRFAQQSNFINDLEEMVPAFYGDVGERLRAWRRPPPSVRTEALREDGAEAESASNKVQK